MSQIATHAEGIDADIVYSIDTGEKPVNETMEAGNLTRNYTGEFESHRMHIRNGRPIVDQLSLDANGYVFRTHETKMVDFLDQDELKRIYYPEIEALVMAETGAARVVIFDHTLRSGDEQARERHQIREPVLRAHNDYTDWSGPQRVRDVLGEAAEPLLANRFAVVQVWRPIRNPIEQNPLALCDARTLRTEDLIASERRYPDRVGETYQIAYNPDHEWTYFPRMQRDEALVFKVYDSMTDGRARFVPHTSFEDMSILPDANPRESIEMRTFAFFEPE
jgi:hypothetical protein